MTDAVREQIDTDAEKAAFRVPYNGSNEFYDKEYLKAWTDGATHQHPIAEKAGYNQGLDDALKLIDQYSYGMTKDQWQDLTRKIEALKR